MAPIVLFVEHWIMDKLSQRSITNVRDWELTKVRWNGQKDKSALRAALKSGESTRFMSLMRQKHKWKDMQTDKQKDRTTDSHVTVYIPVSTSS